MSDVYLSIIIPTLGRKDEVRALFDSIENAKIDCTYEVLVIDQNEDGLLDQLCIEYKDALNVVQHKVLFKGLSKAKNYGIDHASGEVLCFPDDDAEMCSDTVHTALKIIKEKDVECVFGKCVDKQTKEDSVMKFRAQEQLLTLDNFEGAFVEATMFAKKDIFCKHRYDEKLGVGSIFGSQEGYDLVYRMLKDGKKLFFSPEIVFYHPQKVTTKSTEGEVRRAFYYSCGFGYLCKKHGFVKKYKKRLWLLRFGIPVIAVIKHKELKYFKAQKMGLELGYSLL
ncbi:MAG: glycosyltransferase family 2 protein [Acetatifactor sp.]